MPSLASSQGLSGTSGTCSSDTGNDVRRTDWTSEPSEADDSSHIDGYQPAQKRIRLEELDSSSDNTSLSLSPGQARALSNRSKVSDEQAVDNFEVEGRDDGHDTSTHGTRHTPRTGSSPRPQIDTEDGVASFSIVDDDASLGAPPMCVSCNATTTSSRVWHSSSAGPRSLCQACYCYQRKYGSEKRPAAGLCLHCQRTASPKWHSTSQGPSTLCNVCHLHESRQRRLQSRCIAPTHGTPRESTLNASSLGTGTRGRNEHEVAACSDCQDTQVVQLIKGLCRRCYDRRRQAQLRRDINNGDGRKGCKGCGDTAIVYKTARLCRPCYARQHKANQWRKKKSKRKATTTVKPLTASHLESSDVITIDDENTAGGGLSDLGENEYVVDRILAHGMSNDRVPVMIFKVKWQGYSAASDHTWETAESFNDPNIVLNYMRKAGLATSKAASARQRSHPAQGDSRMVRAPLRPGRSRRRLRSSESVDARASSHVSHFEQHVASTEPEPEIEAASESVVNQPTTPSNEVEAALEEPIIKLEPDYEPVVTVVNALVDQPDARSEQWPTPERAEHREESSGSDIRTVADLENAEARVVELEELLSNQSDTSHQLAVERDELQKKQDELQQHMEQLEEQNKVLLSSNASYRRLNEILTQKVEALQVDATIAAQERDALLQYAHQALKGSQANRASGAEDEVSRLRKDNDEFRNRLAKLEANAIAGAEDAT